MIKKYLEYIIESEVTMDSLGEYISKLAEDDKEIRNIVSHFTEEIDQSVDMQNAIDVLDDNDKVQLLKKVEAYQSGEEGEVDTVNSHVELIEEAYGKGVFNSFLKCLTALGLKDNKPETQNVPGQYLIFFRFEEVPFEKVRSVFNRFKSLQPVQFDGANVTLFFGLKTSMTIDYGVNKTIIGSFKLSKGTFNSIKNSKLKSLSGFNKSMSELDINDIKLMSKVKDLMSDFNPGYSSQKSSPVVNGRILSIGWHGYGSWSQGVVDNNDIDELKNKLKSHLSKARWSDKVQMSVNADNFWVYTHIKLK